MIETLSDLPSGVVGVRLSGRLSGKEFRDFRPTWETLVGTGDIRFVEVIDDDYEGFGAVGPSSVRQRLSIRLPSLGPSPSGCSQVSRF